MFMFPLLGDKQRFKFGGVMSILYTHFIFMFCLVFSSFMIQISVLMNVHLHD